MPGPTAGWRRIGVFSVFLTALLASASGCAGAELGADVSQRKASVPEVLAAADDNAAARSDAGSGIAANSASPTPAARDGAVILRISWGRAADRHSGSPGLLLKVDYAANTAVRSDRPPLNIALVLDSSASMAEERKLVYTIDAARWVIENLSDRDSVAIVAFNDRATVLSGAGRVVNKPFLYHRLDEIAPQNFTNLSAGLLEGIAQVDSRNAEGQVRQVFLLTDGRANRGEIRPSALRKIVQEARARGIGVSTFGVGGDFNESLITDMATAGGGRYTYVKSPEQIPTAFQEELHGLLQVVAQNSSLVVAVTGGAITKVYGQLRDEASAVSTLVIGDLRATESGFFLAELRPTGADPAMRAQVRLVYDDPQTAKRVSQVIDTNARRDDRPDEGSVAMLASILDAVESADAAVQGFDIDRYRQAQATFDQLYRRARELALRDQDQALLNQTFVLKHFMGELAAEDQEGLLHGHREAQEKLKKESHYLRYLLTHHRPQS